MSDRSSQLLAFTDRRRHGSNMRHTKFSESEDQKLIDCVKVHRELYDLYHENNKNLYVKDKIWNSISSEMSRDVESCKKRWKDMKDHYFKLKRKQKLETAASVPVKKTSWLLYEPLSFLSDSNSSGCRGNSDAFAPTVQIECVVTKLENNSLSEEEEDAEKNSCGSFTSESFYGFNNEPSFLDEPSSSLSSSSTIQNNNHNDSFNNQLMSKQQQIGKKRKRLHAIEENTQRSLQLLETIVSNKKIKIEPNDDDDDVDMFLKSVAVTLKKLPPLLIAQAKMSILSTVSLLQFSSSQHFRPPDTVSTENPKPSASFSAVSANNNNNNNKKGKRNFSDTDNNI